MKRAFIYGIIAGVFLMWAAPAVSLDPPHSITNYLTCSSCHQLHKAPGPSLTGNASNANLCISCHNSSATSLPGAAKKPFTDAMQAKPGQLGTSHAWNGAMPATSSPSNQYGLRNTADTGEVIRVKLQVFNNVVVCSVCHNQHSQSSAPWDPLSNTVYSAGITNNRHFMKRTNAYNELCEDCHYYRGAIMNYTRSSGDDPSYVANGTNVFSHPVGEVLNAQGYDYIAPLDANGASQTGSAPRYAGDADGNPTNNMALDNSVASGPGKVRCLSCHRVHYEDSNALTNANDVK